MEESPKIYQFRNKICINCGQSYTPRGSQQKRCESCGAKAKQKYDRDAKARRRKQNTEEVRAYNRAYYAANKEVLQERIYKSTDSRRKKMAAELADSKRHPCMDCGSSYPPYVMDFDHVRGKKEFNLSRLNGRSLKRIKEEMEKCDLVCANCHRMRTFSRREIINK